MATSAPPATGCQQSWFKSGWLSPFGRLRAGCNAHQAVRHVETGWKEKRRYAVDCDLKAFFDTVNHDRFLAQLRGKIGGGKLLRLIGRYLRAGVELPDGSREATPLGVPQGGPLSPLLAKLIRSPPPAPSPLAGQPAGCLSHGLPPPLGCLVRFALNNRYLKEQGVPEMREIRIRLHYADQPKSKGASKRVT